jgi:hypothetical protein
MGVFFPVAIALDDNESGARDAGTVEIDNLLGWEFTRELHFVAIVVL